jgi:hypothetical protein
MKGDAQVVTGKKIKKVKKVKKVNKVKKVKKVKKVITVTTGSASFNLHGMIVYGRHTRVWCISDDLRSKCTSLYGPLFAQRD